MNPVHIYLDLYIIVFSVKAYIELNRATFSYWTVVVDRFAPFSIDFNISLEFHVDAISEIQFLKCVKNHNAMRKTVYIFTNFYQ